MQSILDNMNSINELKIAVSEIEKTCEMQEQQISLLKKENERLRKNAKKFVDKELKEENDRLKQRLNLTLGEFDSEKELKAYERFCKKHEKCQLSAKVNNGKAPYVVFNGTGVGICKKVICQVCGKEQDITDISVW